MRGVGIRSELTRLDVLGAPAAASERRIAESPAPPRIIDRSYVLHEQLGEGGMGTVFRAMHRLTGRAVALKVIGDREPGSSSPDSDRRKRRFLALAREFQTLSSLHHPNIIQVLDYGFDENVGPYFTMELLAQCRMISEEAQGQPLSAKVALLGQLLRALSYLHRRGTIHRDLKPSNVLCVDGVVKVTDFGLATKTASQPHDVAGTLEYIAPEIWFGAAPSVASDLYSFGVITHEILDGHLPFQEQTIAARELSATVPVVVTSPPTEAELGPLSGRMGPLLARLLAREPILRPESALDVLRELAEVTDAPLAAETAATRESFLQASEFVGRDVELGTLIQALRRAHEGQGGGWLLGGESGVGKSRITAELRTRALVANACVVGGQAFIEGGGLYELWLPVLRALCLRVDLPDDDAAILSEVVPELPHLLGRTLAPVQRLHPAARQGRLRRAIEALFRLQPRPTLVILEDLQWATSDSLDLVAHLAQLATTLPLLLVCNYRDDEAPRLPERLPAMSALRLRRLEENEVAKLAVSMLGARGAAPELVSYLCRQTEGNPFFLIEVVRALAEQAGQLDRISELDLPQGVLTGGIERMAQRRVDRVPESDRPLLEIAATLGRDLDLAVLRYLEPSHALDRWLVACANAAVLESLGGDWRFAHDKLREAILAHIAKAKRRALHQRVAEALEAIYAGAASDAKSGLLAYHFREAGDHTKAALYSLRAGDRATRLCSYGEAREHYSGALSAIEELPPTNETRRQKIDALLKQIYTTLVADSAEQNFKRAAEARTLLDAIAAEGELTREDQMRLARVNYFHGRIHFYRGETKQALDYYQQVLPAGIEAGDEELIALPSCLIGAALLIQGDAVRGVPLLAQAAGPLERLGEPFEWFRAVGYHGLGLLALGRYETGVAELQRVRDRAHEIGQPSLLSAAHLMSGTSFLLSGDWPLVIEHLAKVLELARETGDKLHLSLAWSGIAWAHSQLGRHDSAAECRASAQRIADTMGGRLMLNDWFCAGDAEMALNAGDVDLALRRAAQVAEETGAAGQLFSCGIAHRVWGEALALGGDFGAADEHMEKSIATHAAGGIHAQVARTRFRWALQHRRRGDIARAESLYASAREDFARFPCAYALAECERVWALGT